MNTRLIQWSICALLLCFAASVTAQTNSWTNSASGKWEDASKWSLGVAPANTQTLIVTNPSSKAVMIDDLTPVESKTVSNLIVSSVLPATNTLSLANARATGILRVLGNCGISNGSQLSITNSDLQVDGIIHADGAISLLGNSSIVSTNSGISIAQSAIGTLTVDGGDLLSAPIFLGRSAGMVGTLKISAGTVSVSHGGTPYSVMLGIGEGQNATGVVWMTGGQLTALNNSTTSGVIQVAFLGVGEMNVSNGTVLCENISICGTVLSQEGTLSIAGGTVSVLQTLSVESRSNYSGHVWLKGGAAAVSDLTVAGDGRAEMVISNGVLSTGTARIGVEIVSYRRSGTLAVAGGSMTASNLIIGDGACLATGTVTLTGGTLFVTNAVHDATLARIIHESGENRLS